MNSFAPLADVIVDSSIWEEPDHVFRVFIGMMSIKSPWDHTVHLDSYKLSRRLHMDQGLVLDALRVLSSPDAKRAGQAHEGRRIAAVEGGWLIINGEEYQKQVSLLLKRARDARAQANYRAKKAGKPLPYPSVKRVKQATPEEEMAAHAEVQSTQRAANQAMQHLNELQGGVEMPEP